MILKGKSTSVKKHSSKSKRAKKNSKMEKGCKDNNAKDNKDHPACQTSDLCPREIQERQCPICCINLDLQDCNFYPCQCGYQICGFCWHKIRTEGNSLCPNCRRTYTENPDCYRPLSQEVLQKHRKEQKQKELQKKKEQIESRKQLANIRVVQKNLVFVHGLPQGIDTDIERYRKLQLVFKEFGPVLKCVVNNKTNYVGNQTPRASIYVTYQRIEDALKANKSLPSKIEEYEVKTSLGTTKYCSNFLKNVHCPKQDCMYLHEIAEEELCFTKDQIHNNDHVAFGVQLYEKLMQNLATRSPQPNPPREIVPVPTPNEQEEVRSQFSSLQIAKEADPTPISSPLPSNPLDQAIQQSKFAHLFDNIKRNHMLDGNDESSTLNFPEQYEEHSNKFMPGFSATSTIEYPPVQKSLLEENTVNSPPARRDLEPGNFIRLETFDSLRKEMWENHRARKQPQNLNTCEYVQFREKPQSQALQGITLNHEEGSIYHKSQSPTKIPKNDSGPFSENSHSPEIHDDDLGFDPVCISLTNLSNIVENSQQQQPPQPIRRDPWLSQMSEQQALQYKIQATQRKSPPPGFLLKNGTPVQPSPSPMYNNPEARNPLINRMSPHVNAPNNFYRTNNFQRYPQSSMPMAGIPSMNGFASQPHRNIPPQTIPMLSIQEMLASRTNNSQQHIQSQSQNLSNPLPFAHLEQNLSPSLWNVNQNSINPSQWLQMENSFPTQNMQDFRPSSPSLSLRRVQPHLRPEFARQLTQPLARFTNPPNFTDNPQYMFPNGQYNQLTNGVPTLP